MAGEERRAVGADPADGVHDGEHAAYYVFDDDLTPQPALMPEALQPSVSLIAENCGPVLCTVMFQAGAGSSLRLGVTRNPVKLTRPGQALKTGLACGGALAYVWPGGGITLMVEVTQVPEGSFGYVPTPARVAPLGLPCHAKTAASWAAPSLIPRDHCCKGQESLCWHL